MRRAAAVLLLLAGTAGAQEVTPNMPTVAAGPPLRVVTTQARELGVAGSGSGVYVDAATFQAYLLQQVGLEECKLRVAARDRVLAETRPSPGWWDEHKFVVGLAIGFVGATALLLEARNLVK